MTKKTREVYEVTNLAAYSEWSVWDSCNVDGSYPGECKHGIEHFLPPKILAIIREREALDAD